MSEPVARKNSSSNMPPLQQDHKQQQSAFTSSKSIIEVSDKKYIIRVLKMPASMLVFIGHADNECLNDMAVAMPMPSSTNKNNGLEVLGTTVIGDHILSSSKQMAEKLSKRFNRQVFVSHNVNVDVLESPIFERAIGDYVRTQTEAFI